MGSFVHLIKEGMEKSGLTLRELARQADLDPSFLSKILSGKRSPPTNEETLKQLAQVLELDPIRLIVSTGNIPSQWQTKLENEEFLEELSLYFRDKSRIPLKKYSNSKGFQRSYDFKHSKTKELSEDLL